MQTESNNRRKFLKQAALTGLGAVISHQLMAMPVETEIEDNKKNDGLRFLFQGDSITDGNRGRNNDPNHIMGHGYAFSIASRVGAAFPEKGFSFYNRGISGNTVPDLIECWTKDALDIKPDVLSMLIGVNDTLRAFKQNDTEQAKKYEANYRVLLHQAKEQLPDCLLVLCEPFIAPVGKVKENWTEWQTEMQKKQEIVQRLAKEYHAVWVPMQEMFDHASMHIPNEYWIWDGIHPTVAGHGLITQQWLKQVSHHLHFLRKLCC
jgi:lysophospholipase L1-like esterase